LSLPNDDELEATAQKEFQALMAKVDAKCKQDALAFGELLIQGDRVNRLRTLYLTGSDHAMELILAMLFEWERDPRRAELVSKFMPDDPQESILVGRFLPYVVRMVCSYTQAGVEKAKATLQPEYYERVIAAAETLRELFIQIPTPPEKMH
jgi:hypothetical protein